MTRIIYTVHMCIGRLTALMALRNYLFRYPLSQPLVKYKIFSMKFYPQSFFFCFIDIIDNTAF